MKQVIVLKVEIEWDEEPTIEMGQKIEDGLVDDAQAIWEQWDEVSKVVVDCLENFLVEEKEDVEVKVKVKKEG